MPHRATLAAAAAGLAIALWSALGHPFDDDEFQHLHIAWALWQGQRPYAELFEHHLVASHALIAPLLGPAQGPWPLFVLRVVGALVLVATLMLWARLAVRVGVRPVVAAGAVLLVATVPMVVLKLTEVRPAVPATLLHAACAAWIFAARGRWRGLVAGLLAGAMILCSQKFVYAASGLWLAVWLLHGWRAALAMGGAGLACGLGWILACLGLGVLRPMWDQVVVMNLHWQRSFPPWAYLTALYRASGVLLALALLGALERRIDRRRLALLAILAGAALQVALVPVPFRQSFLPLFGPLLVLAALALERLSLRLPGPAVGLLVVLGCLPGLRALGEQIAPGHAADRAQMRLVDAMLPPGAPVFDGRGLLFWRPHVGRHATMHEGIQLMLDQKAYAAETRAALITAELPTVILDYRVAALPQALRELLSERYLPHPDDPQVLVPGIRVPRSRLRRRGGTVELPLAGRWRLDWSGGGLAVDGQTVEPGTVLELTAGSHDLQPRGPVRELEFRLERSDGP